MASYELIRCLGLSKTYKDANKKEVLAAQEITFTAVQGQIFGLLGPNGAGKTTTLRMISTLISPTNGTAEIAGHDIIKEPAMARKCMGYMSSETGSYHRLTAREMIEYFGSLYNLKNAELKNRVDDVINLLDMHDFKDRRCGKLSTGQKQRVSIARTIIHNPPVLIFDEPTAGLDVLASRNIVNFIKKARDDGKCIILSTHDMGEAERLCDYIAIIHKGRIKEQGTKEELFAKHGKGNLEEVFFSAVEADD